MSDMSEDAEILQFILIIVSVLIILYWNSK